MVREAEALLDELALGLWLRPKTAATGLSGVIATMDGAHSTLTSSG